MNQRFISQGPADPNMATSGEMIGTSAAYAAGYTGAGMRIAVIDTGIDTDHQSLLMPTPLPTPWRRMMKASGRRAYDLLDAGRTGVLPQLKKRTRKTAISAAERRAAVWHRQDSFWLQLRGRGPGHHP